MTQLKELVSPKLHEKMGEYTRLSNTSSAAMTPVERKRFDELERDVQVRRVLALKLAPIFGEDEPV